MFYSLKKEKKKQGRFEKTFVDELNKHNIFARHERVPCWLSVFGYQEGSIMKSNNCQESVNLMKRDDCQ